MHSETLLVAVRPFYEFRQVLMLLLDILNKRWQSLDLVSMIYECKRSAFHEMSGRSPYPVAERLVIIDSLNIVSSKIQARRRFKLNTKADLV